MTVRGIALVITLVVLGCGRLGGGSDDEAPPPPAPAAPQAPVAPEAPAAAPAVDQPCVVGHWNAADFVAMVRRNVRNDLREGRLERASGTITASLGPVDADGAGELVARANDLVHRLRVTVQGVRATGTHRMDGSSTMPFRMVEGTDRFIIEPPTGGDIDARLSVRTNIGINFDRGAADQVDFTGLYEYECSDEELSVRRVRDDDRLGAPITFERLGDEEAAELVADDPQAVE